MPNSHVKHSYLAAVIEPFLFPNDEWGDQLRAIHDGYAMGPDYAGLSDEELDGLANLLLHHLQEAYEDGWLVNEYEGGDPVAFRFACEEYQRTHREHKQDLRTYRYSTTGMQEAQAAFAEAEKLIPDWMKHVPPDEPVDPE